MCASLKMCFTIESLITHLQIFIRRILCRIRYQSMVRDFEAFFFAFTKVFFFVPFCFRLLTQTYIDSGESIHYQLQIRVQSHSVSLLIRR